MLNRNAMLNFELKLIEVINICYIGQLQLSWLCTDQEQNEGCTLAINSAFLDEYLLTLSMSNAPWYANLVNYLNCESRLGLEIQSKETILLPSEALFSRRP